MRSTVPCADARLPAVAMAITIFLGILFAATNASGAEPLAPGAEQLERIKTAARQFGPTGFRAQSANDAKSAAEEAARNCDRVKFDEAMTELRGLLKEASSLIDAASEAAKTLKGPAKTEIVVASDNAAHLQGRLKRDISGLERLWKRNCDKAAAAVGTAAGDSPPTAPDGQAPATDKPASPQQPSSDPKPAATALQPGADVGKGEIFLIDLASQQGIPSGQVVIIPADSARPQPQPIPIGADGSVTIPKTEPGDRIIFMPACHRKVELDGETVGDGGFKLRVPQRPLQLSFHTLCRNISEKMIDEALADQYRVRLPAGGGPTTWGATEHCFGTGENRKCRCDVFVATYEPLRPTLACAVPTGGATVVGGATETPGQQRPGDTTSPPVPKDGPTTITHGGQIIFVDGDQPREIQGPAPDDPFVTSRGTWGQAYSDQWYLKAVRWLRDDGTTVLPRTANPVIVAVIDTGVDFSHPELVGAGWSNPGSGQAAGRHGWNFIDNSPDIRDDSGHGTIVAGIIAAATGNGMGIAGINPWARIMALKAMDVDGRGGSLGVAKAVIYAADHGARVINLSVGGRTLTRTEQDAVDHAARSGALVVVASGNQGIDTANFAPAGLKNVLTVAAVGPDLKRQAFSNWGKTIGIAAPGVDILSLRARQTDVLQMMRRDYRPGTAIVGQRYYRITGSSFAAPIVTGAASLLFSIDPKLTAEQVKRMLVQSARDLDGIGTNQFSGYGLLDIEAALAADPNTHVEAVITGVAAVQIRGRTVLRVSGTADADRLKEVHIEIGQGDSPSRWKKVSRTVTKPVVAGAIDDLPVDAFRGATRWTLRVVVTHRNGQKREARFKLSLG